MDNNFLHNNYSKADIERYLQGKMNAAEMYALEKAALQDPFLADAIEGYELTNFEIADKELQFTSQEILKQSSTNFSQEKNYSVDDFEKYYQGKMSNTEMYLLERNSLKNPLLADALEGYENANFSKAKQLLTETKTKIANSEKQEAKVVAINSSNKKQWLKIAAAAILMVGVGSTIWLVNNNQKIVDNNNIAQVKQEEIKQYNPQQNNTTITDNNTAIKEKQPLFTEKTSKESSALFPETPPKNNDAVAIIPQQQETNNITKGITENNDKSNENDVSTSKDAANYTAKEVVKMPNTNNTNTAPATVNTKNAVGNNTTNNTNQNILKGKIVNENGEPVIASISVADNQKKQYFTTNNQGHFSIAVPDTNVIVNLNSVGYTNLIANLSTNASNTIVLQKSKEELSEVVVVSNNNSTQKKQLNQSSVKVMEETINTGATPVGGWQAFYAYVNEKKNKELQILDSTITEDVTVEFKVDEEGNPYNISTSRNNNKNVTNKAKEIIKEGPRWTNARKGKKVKVILKF